MSRFHAPIAESIWDMKYRFKDADGTPIDGSVEDSWRRVARALAAVESDPATRQQLLDRLHRKAITWNPAIMIGNYVRVDAVGPALARYRGWTMGIPRIWDVDAK